MQQITDNILMIRPAKFGFNSETAGSNAFQSDTQLLDSNEISRQAIEEFDRMVQQLKDHGVSVLVIQDTESPVKPDAVFPNNWVSFHENGMVITYPMFAPNRRVERREDILDQISRKFQISQRYSFEFYEEEKPAAFLEGTGSMVLDRSRKVAYACLSPRTDGSLVDKFCTLTGMTPCLFHAEDKNGQPIYHTNVMMAIATDFAIVCLDAIPSQTQKQLVTSTLEHSGKKIIPITLDQMEHFAGNMLEVKNKESKRILCLSTTAYKCLSEDQLLLLSSLTNLLPIDISQIETTGGGSVRCMMAEIFLQPK